MASMWYRWTGHISVRLNNARVARLTGSKVRKAISRKSQSRGWDIPKRNPLEIEGKDAPAIQRAISCTKELSIWIFEEKWLNQKQNSMYTSMIKRGVGTQYQPSDDASDPTGPHIIGNQLSKNTQTLIATDQWEKQHVNPGAHWPWRDGSGPQVQGSSLPEIWATTSETTPNLHLTEGRGYLKWHWERLWHCWIASRRKQASRWGTWGLPGAPIWQTTVSEMLSRVQHSKDSNGSPCSNTWFAGHYIQMSALQNNIRQSAQARMPCTMLLGRKKTPLCSRLPIQMWDLPTPFSNKIGPVTAWEAQGPRDSQPVLHRRHQARGWAESRKRLAAKELEKHEVEEEWEIRLAAEELEKREAEEKWEAKLAAKDLKKPRQTKKSKPGKATEALIFKTEWDAAAIEILLDIYCQVGNIGLHNAVRVALQVEGYISLKWISEKKRTKGFQFAVQARHKQKTNEKGEAPKRAGETAQSAPKSNPSSQGTANKKERLDGSTVETLLCRNHCPLLNCARGREGGWSDEHSVCSAQNASGRIHHTGATGPDKWNKDSQIQKRDQSS